MSNRHKLSRFETIVVITIFLLICGFGIFDQYSGNSTYAKVEAQSPPRLQIQDIRILDKEAWGFRIYTICDSSTGNIIYALLSSQKAGLEAIPNGCQRDPH